MPVLHDRWNEDIEINDGEFADAMNAVTYGGGDLSAAVTSHRRLSLTEYLIVTVRRQQTEISELRAMIEAMQAGK